MYDNFVRDASAPWPFTEEKQFELALVEFPEDVPDRWQRIADLIGRTAEEVKIHYDELVRDVMDIESGKIPLPMYTDDEQRPQSNQIVSFRNPSSNKGRSWTVDEHRLFLLGLKECGKGDWRNISRNYVKTRSPSQVASHAQKYFIRLHTVAKVGRKKRSSIHDIRYVPDDAPQASAMDPGLAPIPNDLDLDTLSIQDYTDGLAPVPNNLNMDTLSIQDYTDVSDTLDGGLDQALVLGPATVLGDVNMVIPLNSFSNQDGYRIPADVNMVTTLNNFSNQDGYSSFSNQDGYQCSGDGNMVTTQRCFSNQDGYQIPVPPADVNMVMTERGFLNQNGYQIPVTDLGDVNMTTPLSRFSNQDGYRNRISYKHPCPLQM